MEFAILGRLTAPLQNSSEPPKLNYLDVCCMTDVFVSFLLLDKMSDSHGQEGLGQEHEAAGHIVSSQESEQRCMLGLSLFLGSLGSHLIELCCAGYTEIPSKMPRGISPRVFEPLTNRHELSQTQI